MPQAFPGFPPDALPFLEDLKVNNDRAWFQDNKARYRASVQDPMLDFIEAMVEPLAALSPHFVAEARRQGGSMFRIHRDVRFSKDKRPYKEHAACQFRHNLGRDAHAPGFYVHLDPAELLIGGGIWRPPSEALLLIRRAIKERPAQWQAVIEDKDLQATFGGVTGDSLTRPPKGFSAEDPHIEDIKRKSFFVMRREAPDLALKSSFQGEVEQTFQAAMPLMRFLCKALDVPC